MTANQTNIDFRVNLSVAVVAMTANQTHILADGTHYVVSFTIFI